MENFRDFLWIYHSVGWESWPKQHHSRIFDVVNITEEIIRVQINIKRLAPIGKLRKQAFRLRSSFVVIRRIKSFCSVFCRIFNIRSDSMISIRIGSRNKYGTCKISLIYHYLRWDRVSIRPSGSRSALEWYIRGTTLGEKPLLDQRLPVGASGL